MKKLFFMFLFFVVYAVHAQETRNENLPPVDSSATANTIKNSEESYFIVSAGLSNSAFSNTSKTLNAAQDEKQVFFLPGAGYYHKSGLGIYTSAYLAFSGNSKNPFQYLVTPSYDYLRSKNFKAGISYTYYFGKDTAAAFSSPYQHEVNAYYTNKKGWLNWGLGLDYAEGQSTQTYSKDTTIRNKLHKLQATEKSKLSDFVLTPQVSHNFTWENIISNDDYMSFKPAIMVNTGLENYNVSYTGTISALKNKPAKRKNLKNKNNSQDTPFEIQSIALNLRSTYDIGKFSIIPEWYIEYYFPETTQKLSNVVSIDIDFNF